MNYTLEQMERFLDTRSAWMHIDTLDLVVVNTYSHANRESAEAVGINPAEEYDYDQFYERGWVHIHFENNRYGAKLWAIFTPDADKFTRKVVDKLKFLAEMANLTTVIYGDARDHEIIVEVKQYA